LVRSIIGSTFGLEKSLPPTPMLLVREGEDESMEGDLVGVQ